jgi:hypothetical protein
MLSLLRVRRPDTGSSHTSFCMLLLTIPRVLGYISEVNLNGWESQWPRHHPTGMEAGLAGMGPAKAGMHPLADSLSGHLEGLKERPGVTMPGPQRKYFFIKWANISVWP